MTGSARRLITEALLESRLIDTKIMHSIVNEEKRTGSPFSRLLIDNGYVSEEQLLQVMGNKLKLKRVNILNQYIDPLAANLIPAEMASRHRVMAFAKRENKILVATADPFNIAALDDVAMISGTEVVSLLAAEDDIIKTIDRYYSNKSVFKKSMEQNRPAGGEENYQLLEREPSDAPVIKLVNALIVRALQERASDIHLEPTSSGEIRVRMRFDGLLHDIAIPCSCKPAHLISRVKIMANLDIAEKRLPQDGNIQICDRTREINLRVSTMPTIHGEKIVIRLLEKEKIILPLEQLGFTAANYSIFQRLLLNQSGMILVAGPTGCGKTTTLYSALNYLNRAEDNIITVEDPVECVLEGINQIQVNRRINRTFANTLRSILRQDPNIIMVGEIRDLETAIIATQAALTGHLVLSTLHTNNAAGAVTRLVDMGLEPYLVTASLVGVVAQRLIRMICNHCRTVYILSEEEKLFYYHYFKEKPPEELYRGAGCSSCNHTGYQGRTSLQELLVVDREMQNLILQRASASELQLKAAEKGMQSLAGSGRDSLQKGITSFSEVIKTTFSSRDDLETCIYNEGSTFLTRLQKLREQV